MITNGNFPAWGGIQIKCASGQAPVIYFSEFISKNIKESSWHMALQI